MPRTKAARGRFGKPTGRDVISGFVTGLFSIPEGMAYASLGGFSAPLGLWSGIVPTIIGSAFARTVFMVTTLTSAIALTANSVLVGAGLKPGDVGAIATLTVMVGLVMLILGVLRLGIVMSFVSTAVMTGLSTGIALQIIAGVMKDATGYSPQSSNTAGKIIDAFIHIGRWDWPTVGVTVLTVAIWALLQIFKRLRGLATLIALVVATVVSLLLPAKLDRVSDIATIPQSLPPFTLPSLDHLPALATGAVAIALVALAQSAGIGSSVPNPDGTRPDASKDFTAQGLANIGGGFFGALPTGGSMSRTGVATSAGAKTRWAGIFSGIWLALIVLTVGPLAGYIPMAVIGGLMLVIGTELIIERRADIVLVARTSWLSLAAMVVTFVASTQLPLQQAIFIGAALSIVLVAVSVSRIARFFEMVHGKRGWHLQNPPAELPSGRTTVLQYTGVGFFAEVSRVSQDWPDSSQTTDAALVLSLRGSNEIPSATFMKAFDRHLARLDAQGIPVVICGIPKKERGEILRRHALSTVGSDRIFAATPLLMESLEAAYAKAEELRTASAAKKD
ncbi:MAG: hypothetical protein LBU78_07595 [Microbacterium sp.]|jgi:SulP family sulfate permease|nr:hypothetical protein [Microbacterium sp.]